MECKHLMPCQNARSFIVDDHISHIRIKVSKLSTTCMGYKHYVEDLSTISFFKMAPHTEVDYGVGGYLNVHACSHTAPRVSCRYLYIYRNSRPYCPACRTYEIATRFWVVVICPIIKCLTVLEFSFILFDLCLFITIFNFILNYVLIVIFWIFTYHKIWILLIIYCFIWNNWIIYFLTCLEVFWSAVS